MASGPTSRVIFLSGPISNALSGERFDPTVRAVLEEVARGLECDGFQILSAHREEIWGRAIPDTPEHVFRRDWHFAQACDATVVVLPADEHGQLYRSDGAFIEIGWAVALGKPLFVVTDRSASGSSYLFDGLLGLSAATCVFDLACDFDVAALARALREHFAPPRGGKPPVRLGFCATSFGFGPVSKAVVVADAIRALAPEHELVFFGSDVTERYARASSVFDEVVDLDTDAAPDRCVHEVAMCDGLVNSLNFEVLEHWDDAMPPQFFLDSLAWMWPERPSSIARTRSYLVQNYLLEATACNAPLPDNTVIVPPIVSPTIHGARAAWEAEEGYVLVNLGGCRSPILPPRAFERYVAKMLTGLAGALRRPGHSVHRVLVCGNEALLAAAPPVDWKLAGVPVEQRFLPHSDFIRELRRCERLVTAPGLTTTLEALALNVPCQLLLPQNYSQFRIDAHYRSLGLDAALWPEMLDSEKLRNPHLEEAAGVEEVARLLGEQLANGDGHIANAFERLLSVGPESSITPALRAGITGWDGSARIAQHVVREVAATAAER